MKICKIPGEANFVKLTNSGLFFGWHSINCDRDLIKKFLSAGLDRRQKISKVPNKLLILRHSNKYTQVYLH